MRFNRCFIALLPVFQKNHPVFAHICLEFILLFLGFVLMIFLAAVNALVSGQVCLKAALDLSGWLWNGGRLLQRYLAVLAF